MVVKDVEDDIIGGVEEVADVNGGSTVQQNYMLYSLFKECSDIWEEKKINNHLQVVFKGGQHILLSSNRDECV